MMKFFFFLLFSVCCNSLFSQTYYNIELLNKGQSITPEIAVGKGDITWHMTLNHSCRIEGNETNFSIHNFNTSLQLVIDMGYLTYLCGSFRVGDSLHIEAGITNPGHPLYGYRGKKSYAISQLGSQVYLGCNGINLLPHAMIRIGDTTVCGRNGDILRAYVLHAPSGYRIDWQDSRLRPLGGDSASIEGFPGDTVLSLSAILRDRDGKGLDTAYYKLKLKPLPEVEVTPSYRFCSQGEEYTFSGHFADGNDYHWVHRSYALSATSRKTVVFPEIMEDRDVRYELFVTDRTTGCRNSDTAWVYLRPKAPVVDIDTNTNRHTVKITIDSVNGADSYTVWSRKWDPYCLLPADGGVYHAEPTGTNLTSLDWAEPDMDTLEFYYVTANRTIPGLGTISSLPSDTVGYKQDDLHVQPAGSGRTNNNPISWMFDMKYVKTTGDLFKWVGNENITAVRSWVMEDQSMTASTTRNAAWDNFIMHGMTAEQLNTMGIYEFISSTGITLGQVYEMAALKETEILQFGKLPSRITYTLVNNPGAQGTNNNLVALPFHKIGLSTTVEMFKELTTDVIFAIRLWNFKEQAWIYSTLKSADWDDLLASGMTEEELIEQGFTEYEVSGENRLYPGICIQVGFVRKDGRPSYIWK